MLDEVPFDGVEAAELLELSQADYLAKVCGGRLRRSLSNELRPDAENLRYHSLSDIVLCLAQDLYDRGGKDKTTPLYQEELFSDCLEAILTAYDTEHACLWCRKAPTSSELLRDEMLPRFGISVSNDPLLTRRHRVVAAVIYCFDLVRLKAIHLLGAATDRFGDFCLSYDQTVDRGCPPSCELRASCSSFAPTDSSLRHPSSDQSAQLNLFAASLNRREAARTNIDVAL